MREGRGEERKRGCQWVWEYSKGVKFHQSTLYAALEILWWNPFVQIMYANKKKKKRECFIIQKYPSLPFKNDFLKWRSWQCWFLMSTRMEWIKENALCTLAFKDLNSERQSQNSKIVCRICRTASISNVLWNT
jgi:hypothetical protein